MITWGIDVGATTGYAVLVDGSLKWCGEWNLGADLVRRCFTLWMNLQQLAKHGTPDAIGFERGGWNRSLDNAVEIAAQHGGYYGIVQTFAVNCGATVRWFAPATIKKRFEGSGRADKAAMEDAYERRFGHWPRGDNAADAAAIAVVLDEELRTR